MNKNALDLKACRLCLETNCRLYDINKNKLTNILDDFTSSTASDMPGIPPYVCSFCCALLRKATTFRNRCMEIQNYLHECSLIEPLSIDIIKKIDRSRIKNQLNTTEILTFHLDDGDTIDDKQIEIKSENESEKESENNDNDDFRYEYIEMDLSIENQSDSVQIEDIVKSESSNQDDISKSLTMSEDIIREIDTKSKKTKNKMNKDVLKKVLQQHILDATDDRRKSFWSFILEKYVLEKKEANMDPFDLDDEVLENKNFPNAEDLEKMDPNERIFYEYVNEKYKKGTLEKKEVVDVWWHTYRKRNPAFELYNPLLKKKPTRIEFNIARHNEVFRRFGVEFNFEAVMLSKEEQLAELTARKDNPKFVASRYKCEVCFRGFQMEKTYRNHLIAHDPRTGDKVCEICQQRFSSPAKLSSHTVGHRWRFTCKSCGAVFKCGGDARNHYERHKGIKYTCEHCGKSFARYRTRVDHIRIYHGTSRCDICYKGLAKQGAISLHKTKAHKQIFICDVCNVTFNKKSALIMHLSSLKTTCLNVRPCSACGENLKTDAELEDHIISVHPYIRPALKLRCCPCGHAGPGATHNYDDHNIDHKITHDYKMAADSNPEFKMAVNTTEPKMSETNNETNESCNCPCKLVGRKIRPRRRKVLERKEDIKINASKEDHDTSKKKKFMCEVCAKGFKNLSSLQAHQLVHTGEKPHECSVCGKRFRLKFLLGFHMNTHTGERPFKCPHCPKAFRCNTANYRHQLVHTKKRPFRCDICEKTFQTSTSVKTHVKTVHMKIPMPPRIRNRKKVDKVKQK